MSKVIAVAKEHDFAYVLDGKNKDDEKVYRPGLKAVSYTHLGKILLNYAKDKRNKLYLNVYQKNARAISFYKREEFEIQHSGLDEATGEKDYVMTWQHK